MAKECRSTTQKPKCGHCNKKCHTDDKCWQKHGGGPSGGNGQPSTQINFTTSFNQDPCGFSFMAADNPGRDETMRDSGLTTRGNEQMRSYDMIVDSGCTGYMLKDSDMFSDLEKTRGGVVGNANSIRSRIEGHGTAEYRASATLEAEGCILPSYIHNLVSVSKLNTNGIVATFNKDEAWTKAPDGTKLPLMRENNLFKLKGFKKPSTDVANNAVTIDRWHQRLGHNNTKDVGNLEQLGW